jgi:hypothetical protein
LWRQRASTKGSAYAFFGGGFYDLFFFPLFFESPGGFSGGVFGVENAKTRVSGPEIPKTGSPLAKGELMYVYKYYTIIIAAIAHNSPLLV